MASKFDRTWGIPLLGSAGLFRPGIKGQSTVLLKKGIEFAKKGRKAFCFWIGPTLLVSVVDPEAAKTILESTDIITKSDEYKILFPWLGTGLLTSTGEKWKARRKMLTPAFHFKKLNEFITTHDYQAKVMLDQLKQFAISGEEFDLFPYIKRMALDIICETSMGTTVDAQHNHDHPYVLSVKRLNELAFSWIRFPWCRVQTFWYLLGYGSEYDSNLKTVTDFTKKVINDKWIEFLDSQNQNSDEVDKKKMAFLDLLLELRHEGKLDFEDIREEVDTFMFEGHDTTSASMGWTLWAVAHDQDIQAKIHEEVDQIFGDSDRDCTNEDLKEMKYLEKCIKESLRMFPSVPFFARRVEEDFDMDGEIIPKGATAVVFPLLLHYNPMHWENPLKYDPERFSESNLSSKHAYAHVPFSAGPRNCIGQKFAVMEEKTCLSWFFRKYRISSRRRFKDNVPQPEIIMKPSIGFPLYVHFRE